MRLLRRYAAPKSCFLQQQHRLLSRFRVVEHIVPCSHTSTYPGATRIGRDGTLKLAVKQYVPLEEHDAIIPSQPITIIGGHANGFPKELYEPLWDDLYDEIKARGHSIGSIWVADIAQQGASGILNGASLGNDPNWWDHARDLLFLINLKQTEIPQPLIGIGHSMGGSILTSLALLHPRLLQGLVLIDPVIQTQNPSKAFAPASTYRRDVWPSRTEAETSFSQSKFYQSWDKRVLREWLQYGLTDIPAAHGSMADSTETNQIDKHESKVSPVRLRTSKAQEVFHYLRPLYKDSPAYTGMAEASADLHDYIYPDIDESILEEGYYFYRPEPAEIFNGLPRLLPPVQYIFGKASPFATEELQNLKLSETGKDRRVKDTAKGYRATSVTLETGHLVPFERPHECAVHSAAWIDDRMIRWTRTQKEWEYLWTNTETADLDSTWLDNMPNPRK